MEELVDGYYGCTGDESPEELWLGADIELPKPRHTWKDNKFQYQQTEINAYSCTLHGAFGALSDNLGRRITMDERRLMFERAVQKGLDPNRGWQTNLAVDLVRRWWNEFNANDKVSTYSYPLASDEFHDAIQLGYTFACSYRGNKSFNTDRNDGILDASSFGKSTYGHVVRITASDEPDTYNLFIDNYPDTRPKSNSFKVKRSVLKELVANGVFFSNAYIFVFQNDMNNYANVPPWAIEQVKALEAKGAVLNYATINEPIAGTEAIGDMFQKVGVFSKGGLLTAARCAVIAAKLISN